MADVGEVPAVEGVAVEVVVLLHPPPGATDTWPCVDGP